MPVLNTAQTKGVSCLSLSLLIGWGGLIHQLGDKNTTDLMGWAMPGMARYSLGRIVNRILFYCF